MQILLNTYLFKSYHTKTLNNNTLIMIKIAFNNVNAKIFDCEKKVKMYISKILSYEVPGAEYSNESKYAGWDGKISFFNNRTDSFPSGFVNMVKRSLNNKGYDVQLVTTKAMEAFGELNPVIEGFSVDVKYDYQMETTRRLVSKGKMVAQVATGGGKSLICQYAYLRIKRKTLFLTTRSVLMYQMKRGFDAILKDYEMGIVGDGVYQIPKTHDGIVFGMVQTLSSNLKDPDQRAITIKFLESFEFIILEEAHEVGGNEFHAVMGFCKNAYFRLGLTATPFMRDSSEANMRLMAVCADIGIRVSEQILIERAILATPYFKFIETPKPKDVFKTTPWRIAYDRGIVDNNNRNESILREARRASQAGLSVLILIQRKRHGEMLNEMLCAVGVKASFLNGSHKNGERQTKLNELRDGVISVLIGTSILDVGVDVPAIGMIILAGGGKAEVATRQRIGRGLRAKKTGPNVAFIIDFKDDFNKTLHYHAKERYEIIEKTDGFREGILSPFKDFDYEQFCPHIMCGQK
jgi:superfamily II DNA or RNA helicase